MSPSNDNGHSNANAIRCHYDVLGVERTADATTIKKAHRKLALQYHPDKNQNDPETAAEQFRFVQQAYECLSDPTERQWYDEHRDAILAGWSSSGNDNPNAHDMLFQVVPYMYAGCFRGFGDDDGGFYAVYRSVFDQIYQGEATGTRVEGSASALEYLATADFGTSTSAWTAVATFYQAWESFASGLNYSWEDDYDVKEAPNRRVRRAMEEANRKARKAAKKARNDDVGALVRFVKKRDPRVQARLEQVQAAQRAQEQVRRDEQVQRKKQAQQAREDWKLQAQQNMAQQEEQDRLAGRLRLADLEDDYDYYGGGGKKRGKKGKKKKNNFLYDDNEEEDNKDQVVEPAKDSNDENTNNLPEKDPETNGERDDDPVDPSTNAESETADNDETHEKEAYLSTHDALDEHDSFLLDDDELEDDLSSSSEEEEEPDVWRCECCRKDFKSAAQMENHMKSKKHKENYKKFQKKMETQMMEEFLVS